MDFSAIKLGFQNYLSELNEKSENEYIEEASTASIFMYSSEFKEYLVDEVGVDASIFSKSISEILSMDFENGKLVEKDDVDSLSEEDGNEDLMTGLLNDMFEDEQMTTLFDTNNDGTVDGEEATSFITGIAGNDENATLTFDDIANNIKSFLSNVFGTSQETDPVNDLLNKICENKTAIKVLDIDGDGEISDEEKAKFTDFVKGYDGDDSELTEQDLKLAFEEIMDGKFSYDKDLGHAEYNNEELTVNEPESGSAAGTDSTTASQSQGTGSTGGSSSYTPSTGSTSSGSTISNETTSDTMTVEELEKKKSEQATKVEQAQEDVNAVHTGENSAVKSAKEDYEEAKQAYDDAVENDDKITDQQKKDRQENLDQIDSKQNEIDGLNVKINDQKALITEQESLIAEDESNIQALNAALDDLPDESEYSDDPEKQAEIAEKREEIKKAIDAAEAQKKEDEDRLNDLEADLKEFEDSLQTAEDDMAKLETTRKNIEDEISANCSQETKDAMKAFNEAKTNVEQVKSDELEKAEKTLTEAQAALDDINKELNEKKAEETKKEYSVSTSTLKEGLFSADGALAGQEDLVAEIADKYGIEPEFLAAIICLESGYGTSNLAVNHNNFGGVTGSGDAGSVNTSTGYTFACYSSVEAGLDAMAKNLAAYSSRYSDVNAVDIDNVDAIGGHYCVGGDWANKIKKLYAQIKGN